MRRLLLLLVLLPGCGAPLHQGSGPSCLTYSNTPPVAGSIYYKYKGVEINLPSGKKCIMPDGSEFGAG